MEELKRFANWWSLLAVAGAAITAAAVKQDNPVGMFLVPAYC
jgi:hypothetical protein